MSYHKPFHISRTGMKNPGEILHFLKSCGQYGLLPNRMASFEAIKGTELPPTRMSTEVEQVLAVTSYLKRDKDLIDKYIPVILKESQMGWEPVTYAISSDTDIQVERFGPLDGRVLFSVYNRSDSEKTISLKINTDALNIPEINQVKGMISGKSITPENPLKLKLEAYELDVILIGKLFTE
jgi:hypothetical protein